jgi:adenylyl- and sulfurtransferase ThiI
MYKAFLIKYAEIGIKGKNRYIFENALRDQIKNSLRDLGNYLVTMNKADYILNVQMIMIMKRQWKHYKGYLELHKYAL